VRTCALCGSRPLCVRLALAIFIVFKLLWGRSYNFTPQSTENKCVHRSVQSNGENFYFHIFHFLLYITSCFHLFSPNRKNLFPLHSHSNFLIFSYQENCCIRLGLYLKTIMFQSSNKMKHSYLHFNWILIIFFHGIVLLKSARIHAFADESDRLALLDFKKRISEDPLQIMSS
jgi:hypothetical protein